MVSEHLYYGKYSSFMYHFEYKQCNMFSDEKRTFLNTFQYWEGRKRLLMNVVSLVTGMLGITIMHYSCFPINSFVLPFIVLYGFIINIAYFFYWLLIIWLSNETDNNHKFYLLFLTVITIINIVFPSLSFL